MPLIRYLTKHSMQLKMQKNEKKGKFKYCHNKNRLHSTYSRHFLSVWCQRRSSGEQYTMLEIIPVDGQVIILQQYNGLLQTTMDWESYNNRNNSLDSPVKELEPGFRTSIKRKIEIREAITQQRDKRLPISYLALKLRHINKTHTESGAENALFQVCLTITEPFSPFCLEEIKVSTFHAPFRRAIMKTTG